MEGRKTTVSVDTGPSDLKRYLAEFMGTFVLVFGGVGAAVIAGDRIGGVGIALAFGLSLLAMVYAIGPISKCHINPAVTFGAMLAGRTPPSRAIGYVCAQILGGIVAALFIFLIAKGSSAGYLAREAGMGANGYGAHSPGGYGLGSAFFAEIILTFLLVYTVLATTHKRAETGFAGMAIGLVLTLIHLVGIPITNTSVNPARSIGPALFQGTWAIGQLWMFIVAPLLGAAVAAAVYRVVNTAPESKELEVEKTQRARREQPA